MKDASRYTRTDGKPGTVEAVQLAAGKPDDVTGFLGPGEHAYDGDAGVLHGQTRRGVPLTVPDGSWVLRDEGGRYSHMTDEAFTATYERAKDDSGRRPARRGAQDTGSAATSEPQ